jgi:8-oxo-dGTP diphosphatase
VKVVDVAFALISREGRLFLQRRDPAGAVLPGVWEFPGGKMEPGESPIETLRRELREEVGIEAAEVRALPVLEHAYPEVRVRLHPYRVDTPDEPRAGLAWGWFTPAEAARLPLPEANLPLLHGLMEVPCGTRAQADPPDLIV